MYRFIGLVLCVFSVAATADFKRCDGSEKSGEHCLINVGDIHPTQFSVGKITADCKKRTLEQKSLEELQAFLFEKKRHIPAYITEEKRFFVSDKHHLLYALYYANTPQWQGKQQDIIVRIVANYNYLNPDMFWQSLNEQQQVWIYDENDQKVNDYTDRLSQMNIGDLNDDPYRTLSRWVRRNCGYIKKGNRRCEKLNATQGEAKAPYFLEQYWARYLRQHFNDNTPQSLKQLQDKLPEAIDAVLDKEATSLFFKTQELNAIDYGQNQTGEYSAMTFDLEQCE